MMHPRLSVSEICTFSLPFSQELGFWDELDVKHVGLLGSKIEAHGRHEVIAALRRRGITAATTIAPMFDLGDESSWGVTRAAINGAVDFACDVGGCVYFTPGRRVGRLSFLELTSLLSRALEPSVAYADSRGIRLAIEPSQRTDMSFVHTLRDALDVIRDSGIAVVADLGNCWAERDHTDTVRRAGSSIALVQFADAVYGSSQSPPPGGRAVPGDGDTDVRGFLRAALDTGYEGPLELELIGPLIDAEGSLAATRRGAAVASALLDELGA